MSSCMSELSCGSQHCYAFDTYCGPFSRLGGSAGEFENALTLPMQAAQLVD